MIFAYLTPETDGRKMDTSNSGGDLQSYTPRVVFDSLTIYRLRLGAS